MANKLRIISYLLIFLLFSLSSTLAHQFSRPDADVSNDGWQGIDSGGPPTLCDETDSELFSKINGTEPGEGSVAQTLANVNTQGFIVNLSAVTDPQSTNSHIIRATLAKTKTGGRQVIVNILAIGIINGFSILKCESILSFAVLDCYSLNRYSTCFVVYNRINLSYL